MALRTLSRSWRQQVPAAKATANPHAQSWDDAERAIFSSITPCKLHCSRSMLHIVEILRLPVAAQT